MLRGGSTAIDEEVVEILPPSPSPLVPTSASTPTQPLTSPTPPIPSSVVKSAPLSPPIHVGPSAPEKVLSVKERILHMGAKVKEFAFIFEDEKLAKVLLDLILLPQDQKE